MTPMLTCSGCAAKGTMGRCAPCACCTMPPKGSSPMAGQAPWSVSPAGVHAWCHVLHCCCHMLPVFTYAVGDITGAFLGIHILPSPLLISVHDVVVKAIQAASKLVESSVSLACVLATQETATLLPRHWPQGMLGSVV